MKHGSPFLAVKDWKESVGTVIIFYERVSHITDMHSKQREGLN